jgi:tetratricopeptide (TPR) repeat protein
LQANTSITILLLGITLATASPAFSQSKADLGQVNTLSRRLPTSCAALIFIAGIAQGKGEYKKAENCYKKVLDIYKNDPGIGAKAPKYAWILSRIALCQSRSGNKTEAAKQSKEALALVDGLIPDRCSGEEGNFVITVRQNCEMILGKDMPPPGPPRTLPLELKTIPASDIANLEETEKQTKECLRQAEKKNKASSASMKDMLYLANIYTLEKKNKQAEPLFKKSITLAEKIYGKNASELIDPLSNYGYLLQETGRQKQAEALLKRMQQIRDSAESGSRSQIGVKP